MADLRIEYVPVSGLVPYSGNARKHSKKQVQQIADSIRSFGFTNPILTDASGMVLAGHGRLLAAAQLGLEQVPCVRIEGMSEAQKRAYIIADNKLALQAGWDDDLLRIEFQSLLDLGFDLHVTGFSIAEVDVIMEELSGSEAGNPADDLLPDPRPKHVVSQLGDLWVLGPHRLLCGDALDPHSFEALLGSQRADIVFADPPYNVPIQGHVGGSGATKHREFVMASGEMSQGQFTDFLTAAAHNLAAFSTDGSIHFLCMDWRHQTEILAAGKSAYSELKNVCVWVKDNGGMGTFYRSRHELIFVFKNGTAPHINSFELGQHGRYRTNVWEYRGVNTLKKGRLGELAMHPTVKPVAMIADAIRDVSKRNSIVVDCFAGSGSTLVAAHKTGRRGYMIELDPIYVDCILRRWQEYAKDDAVLLQTGQTFDAIQRDGRVSGELGKSGSK